jgi:zinc/manganese transport system substrate-binding protein
MRPIHFRRIHVIKILIIIISLLISLHAGPACARLNVVATLPWIGSIVGDIGKDKVNVTVLVKPAQDPHMIEAKPSMILAARKADVIMYNGLDLEIGYLPILIESSKNPKLQPGRPGNFDCSRFVSVIEKPTAVDRSLGDVHPLGNPHYHLSPKNMRNIAEGIARRLQELDPDNAAFYKTNAASFRARLDERLKVWGQKPLRGKKFISYHKFFEYLANEYGFELVGYIEAKPGIPPSAGHIETLIDLAKRGKIDGILTTAYFPMTAPDFLSRKTGVKVITVPHEVGSTPQAGDWFSLMDLVFAALSS